MKRSLETLVLASAATAVVFLGCEVGTAPSATGAIRGEVTMEGQGLEGVTVSLSDGTAVVTTSKGSFRFHGMPPGTYEVSISGYPTDAVFSSTSRMVTVGPAGGPATVAFSVRASNSDRATLIALYNATGGPNWVINTNWLTDAPLGEWYGVKVNDQGRVQGLDLYVFPGSMIPPEIGNLSSLESLEIFGGLVGLIPPEIGSLANLTKLRLGEGGRLAGPIPPEIGNLANLRYLYLQGDLAGPIPPEIGRLANLKELGLWGSGLSGPIPSEIGKLANLEELLLKSRLDSVPPEIGKLAKLKELHLTGSLRLIPPEIGDLTSLTELSLFWFGSAAPILPDISRLSNLESLDLGNFSGVIPPGIGKLTNLRYLHIMGGLTAPAPPEIGDLASLRYLVLEGYLGAIPPEIGKLSNLEVLRLQGNDLAGPIPSEIGRLANLKVLQLFGRELSGAIPPEIGRLANLTNLGLGALAGAIPPEIGQLTNLTDLGLWRGNSSGPIPPELGRLSSLKNLWLDGFSGPVPSEIGNLVSLREMVVEGRFSGEIPPEIGNLANLWRLYLWGSGLIGAIPREIGRLVNLEELWISGHNLSDALPPEIGELARLRDLRLESNDLSGPVPTTIGGMSSLEYLDLTNNPRMSGPLPASMTELRRLRTLLADSTDLCAPTDVVFRGWLTRVEQSRIKACFDGGMSAAYLVQAVQSREHPVPLVAGEKALLRVFPTAKQATTAGIPDVQAHFFHDGRQTYVVHVPGTAGVPIPTHVDEGSLDESVNAEIPGYVIQPGLEMVIEIDPDGTLDAELLATRRIPETGRLDVAVSDMPLFDLTLIPFVWTQTHDSSRVELVKAVEADPENHGLLRRTRTLLPIGDIKVTAHEAVLSSSNSAHDLYHEVSVIRAIEGGTGYFMGILPPAYSGNAAGLANRPGKVSVSSASGSTIAHELGHNLSLGHVRCGNRNPGFVDHRYPHPDGSIGAWGYDFRDGGAVVPASHKDLMSYCGPSWISDYHFTNAFSYRARDPRNAAPASTTPTKSILLWGGIGADRAPYLEPAFVVEAPPLLPSRDGEYRVSGHAKDGGGELFYLSFDMPELADGDGSSSFAFVLPVDADADWQDDLASITLTGPSGGSYVLNGESDLPTAILRDPQTGRVQGLLRGQPRVVMQVARDATARSARPEFEVLFSRGIPEAAAWRR